METHVYSVVWMGNADSSIVERFRGKLEDALAERGLPRGFVQIITPPCSIDEKSDVWNYAVLGIYWDSEGTLALDSADEVRMVGLLSKHGCHIIPVCPKSKSRVMDSKSVLSTYNAEFYADSLFQGIGAGSGAGEDHFLHKLAEDAVLSLGISTQRRKIFISYKRAESQEVAQQLYREFKCLNYDVFLDAVSLEHGVRFQEELKNQLSVSDVLILLVTKKVEPVLTGKRSRDIKWVKSEITYAQQRGIGIYCLAWPGIACPEPSFFHVRDSLEELVENKIPEKRLEKLIQDVESFRVHALAVQRSQFQSMIDIFEAQLASQYPEWKRACDYVFREMRVVRWKVPEHKEISTMYCHYFPSAFDILDFKEYKGKSKRKTQGSCEYSLYFSTKFISRTLRRRILHICEALGTPLEQSST